MTVNKEQEAAQQEALAALLKTLSAELRFSGMDENDKLQKRIDTLVVLLQSNKITKGK
ncbi:MULTISPECIES: hypothetical protein [Grimontia]|uniref:Uncharacterized protein n=1 Tax=Grimontia marina TaxID=646534 RepID=A0A128FJ80_9GAMM|nr:MULTISPECIES: hypothetical protein [Grimontia]WRW01003.1 hypothetical protein VP504_21405 [Grimontia sp. NTOU-MAR1]CZF86852.1 hypothetical protein GMA8713_04891 [Grimontia marina]